MKIKTFILSFIAIVGLTACKQTPVTPRSSMPKEYTEAWQEIHGHCYDSIPYAVVSLDLYSDGLSLDADHRMQGTGYNLYISDIFVPDSLLEQGTYTSLPKDSLSTFDFRLSTYTFLPGRVFEGTPTGLYLLYVQEGRLMNVQLLDSGSFVVRDTTNGFTDLQFKLYYTSVYGTQATYETHFQGVLHPWQKQ